VDFLAKPETRQVDGKRLVDVATKERESDVEEMLIQRPFRRFAAPDSAAARHTGLFWTASCR